MEAEPGQAAQTEPPSHKQQQNDGISVFLSPNIVHFTWYTTHFLHYNLHTGHKHLAKRGQERKGKRLAYGWAPTKCIKNQVWELNSLSNGQSKSSFSLKLSSLAPRSPFQLPQAIIYLLPQRAHPSAPQAPTVPSLTPSVVIFRRSSEQLVEFVRQISHFVSEQEDLRIKSLSGFSPPAAVYLLPGITSHKMHPP